MRLPIAVKQELGRSAALIITGICHMEKLEQPSTMIGCQHHSI